MNVGGFQWSTRHKVAHSCIIMAMSKSEDKTKKTQGKPDAKRDNLLKILLNPEVESWMAILFAYRKTLERLEQALLANGCSASRFQILFFLYFDGTLSPVQISRKMSVTRGNISTFLKRMEADRLLKRRIPEGQKRPVYSLTKHGKEFFEGILPNHVKRVRQLVPALSKESVQLLKQVIAQDHKD